MFVIRGIFGHQLIKVTLKINLHGGVSVFIEGQTGRGVVNENMDQAYIDF
jgi:hypothetical protein